MNEGLLRFLNNEINAIKTEVIISREKLNNDKQLIYISVDDLTLFNFWHNPNKSNKKNSDKKSTGGKRSYIMIFLDDLIVLMDKGLTEQMFKDFLWLSRYTSWNTGILATGRGKKRRALNIKDLATIYNVNERQARNKINKLESMELLVLTNDGYKINPQYICKGGKS